MVPVSIVIITKNEAEMLAMCINAARLITDDIVVVDNDSSDGTTEIAYRNGCRVYHENWDGYGANKNKGVLYARHNWILSIDADEIADFELIEALQKVNLDDNRVVYDIPFRSYFGKKLIRFGSWGRDHHIRLFNRKLVKWSESPVHETLVLPKNAVVKKLKGHLHHFSVKDGDEFLRKAYHYAQLSAGKYRVMERKPTFMKLYMAPLFHFVKNYIVFLGFLDGREGFNIAKMISKHTRLKYLLLKDEPESVYTEAPELKDKLMVEY